ncbi:hypothetical protein [Paenibacillus xylanexedens]|uniref:hypothetical protein n=1 Tax=Paenibacillus xylanexedens TaxID=528191 RepID=UPI000F5438FD|nr:hypothetical protein [Paenibacillus xylanexedens]
MKNYRKETITEEKEIHESTTCNKCGKTTKYEQVDHYVWENFSYEFHVNFKEGSVYEREKWKFDLCENCVIETVKSLKIAPEWFNFSDKSQEVFEQWKLTGNK